MKPPFELPVEKKPDFANEDLFRVESANGLFLSFSLKEDEADYIVTAINSREKLVEAFRIYGQHLKGSGCPLSYKYNTAGYKCTCGFEQALKESGEPK